MSSNDLSIDYHTKPYPNNDAIGQIIRVDQAGEYGAVRIYAGQCAALKHHPRVKVIEQILQQEQNHLNKFNNIMINRRVRPTLLSPVWHVAGYVLGYVTAKMGEQSAMACTVAIEEVIDQHYQQQEQYLKQLPHEQQLLNTVVQCRQEELEHKDIGINMGASAAPFYNILTNSIKMISKTAIWLSKRL